MTALAGDKNADTGWRTVLLEMLLGIRSAVLRFPAVAFLLLAAAIQANLLIVGLDFFADRDSDFDPELVIGLSGGAIAALAAALFGEARGYAAITRALSGLVVGLIASALIAFSQTFYTFEWTLVAGLAGAVLVAAFIGSGNASSFWMFSARSAFAAILAFLAFLLFAGGVSAILASLTLLFGLDIPEELYEHVWTFTGLFAAPLFGLGQLPDRFDEEPGHGAHGFMDRGMRALGDFVAAPLLILYALILHAYAVKIVISGEVPEGQIGWLVLVYGLCVFGALLIINPFFDRARAPTRFFLRFWPFLLPVPLALLFYAVALRVGAYGVTPDRFLLGLFGIVASMIVLLQVFPRLRGDIRWIAALPALALIFGSFGPQGALGVSLTSQTNRFLDIVNNPPVDSERHQEALSALGFLSGNDALARAAPEGMDLSAKEGSGFIEVAEAWGLDPTRRFADSHSRNFDSPGVTTAFTTNGYDTIVRDLRLNTDQDEPVTVDLPAGQELAFTLQSGTLVVTRGSEVVRFALPRQRIVAMIRQDSSEAPEIALQSGSRRLKLLLSYVYLDDQDPPQVNRLDASVLLRAEDWS